MFKMPDGPIIRGTYPNGITWKAVELDQGRAMIVTDEWGTLGEPSAIHLRPAHSAYRQAKVCWRDTDFSISALHDVFRYVDREEYPQVAAWVESVVSKEELAAELRSYYRWCHKSWQALFSEAPILSLADVVEWLQTTDMRKQDNGSWLYVEEEYDSSGDRYRHRSLRLFDMTEDTDPCLLLVCRDYLDSSEDMVTISIRNVEALKECLADDTTTSAMLKDLTNFNELERRLV